MTLRSKFLVAQYSSTFLNEHQAFTGGLVGAVETNVEKRPERPVVPWTKTDPEKDRDPAMGRS